MSHYKKHPSGVECIEIVKYENFNIGNALKYIWRRKEKGTEIQDIQKAIYYLNQELQIIGEARLSNMPVKYTK